MRERERTVRSTGWEDLEPDLRPRRGRGWIILLSVVCVLLLICVGVLGRKVYQFQDVTIAFTQERGRLNARIGQLEKERDDLQKERDDLQKELRQEKKQRQDAQRELQAVRRQDDTRMSAREWLEAHSGQ